MLGGLISDDRQQVKSQVPIIGDIPVVGELFKSRRESRTKRTLFVFLRPTILRDKLQADAATRARYDRARRDGVRIHPNHRWGSGRRPSHRVSR